MLALKYFPSPPFSYAFAKNVGISGAWQTLVAGSGGVGNSLNLDQFERHEALLRLNLHF
jgi:hypothetical protein